MIKKIARQEALELYPSRPYLTYDNEKDEETYHYPKYYSRYYLSISAKSIKTHIPRIIAEFLKVCKACSIDQLLFLGQWETPWLFQQNDYIRAQEAMNFLKSNKVGKRFNGALMVNISDLPHFMKHLAWLSRCNATLPYFHFTDPGENIVGHLCKYGNLHLDTLNESTDKLVKEALPNTSLIVTDDCYNPYNNRIVGRRIIV